jgi:hypothetical protein
VAPWPVVAAVSAVGSGSVIATSIAPEPISQPSTPATRSTYRNLLMKGLAPDEAANLTAFLCGLPVADQNWTLRQVNELLFLRELRRSGRFDQPIGPRRPN